MRRVSIEQPAENTVQRTLLRGLNVRMRPACSGCRPVAGVIVHRSFWSIPCVVRDGGIAEDDSFAENRERVWVVPYSSQRGAGMQRRSPFLLVRA
jgi:ParB family chromosome partitioning protein